jgi:hypothetical protein
MVHGRAYRARAMGFGAVHGHAAVDGGSLETLIRNERSQDRGGARWVAPHHGAPGRLVPDRLGLMEREIRLR